VPFLIKLPAVTDWNGMWRALPQKVREWGGVAWFRKTFTAPEYGKNERAILTFEEVLGDFTLYVNGKKIGSGTPFVPVTDYRGPHIPQQFDVTEALRPGEKNVMSVDIPTFQYKTRTADENDIYSYGFAFTSGDLDGAVKSLADVLPDMIRLAECEKACQLMAAEIEKTRRRVNALEHVIIPETEQSIKYITMKLDENERSTQIRLMKVKDMMLEETHHYSEK